MSKFKIKAMVLLIVLSFVNTGCFDDGKSNSDTSTLIMAIAQANALEIQGNWQIGFYSGGSDGGTYGTAAVSTTLWNEPGNQKLTILETDSSGRHFYYLSSATDPFNPNTYGRFDWNAVHSNDCPGGASICFEYCQAVFGKSTLAEAKNDATVSDSSNFKSSGCGGFGWNYAIP